jgi:hypothetical protein
MTPALLATIAWLLCLAVLLAAWWADGRRV